VGIEAQGFVIPLKPELSVYPNPTTGMVTLNINPSNETVLNMDLVNSMGQVLNQKVFNNQGVVFTRSIDLSDLPNGIYYLVLKTKQGVVGQARIIKK
jgi:pectate lyase